ncbi:ATP phosphoribosyltransferase [Pikeienuella piscinae]|uniref:ATP phosphoribosyltransferase n=1 Tax=Pikeienuella piscinae TaxID=2748098 RepID=A0A7M3T5P3_9RHOB|nr:ATP phosphoribosyltransferase [Pikeienuella piscinae]QIE57324.1 ATP phosphoribosyltransferase [Pikeienuella piscinae]
MSVKLGLPSKGRLQEASVEWLAARGVNVERADEGREYAGRITGVEGVELQLLSAAEIPLELAAGRIHLGVTGEDLIRETIPGWEAKVDLGPALGFGHADLIVAVPAIWVDVETLHDLDAAAAQFRRRHGRRLRIATKYHSLARSFLTARGVADYRLVDSQGATEATALNLTAEAIIDITSSGETLRANHLKPLADGLILASEARLCRSLTAPTDAADAAVLAALRSRIGA